jgi:hypothetical protein
VVDHDHLLLRRVELTGSSFSWEGPAVALSSRTGADRERQQRIGYDAFAEPTMNERYLRTADVRVIVFRRPWP